MGCINAKQAVRGRASPVLDYSTAVTENGSVILEPTLRHPTGSLDFGNINKREERSDSNRSRELKKSKKENANTHSRGSFSFRLGFSHRYVQAEQNAAGWPTWLSAVAGEAIHGWVPLRADSFEKLEKIGQGTYSSVFRAREVQTGRIVALKKVRVDNFQAESIRFMAREIMILRRLDHPNIMKLEGVITSRLSSSIYLVFEYMEHDLAGLISCPDIKFSDSQVKCYMTQLLCGVEHCHLRGIMHRDIKASNILVNNEGILKLGDFGLANILTPKIKQPLTSRVVTLWYRPPELLMGSTNYGVTVDVWSVGCVFAELLIGKPLLKGRTEVEQLHKIFKLCGSPPDEFWKKSKLPHAAMFKPLHNYESSLREKCKDFTPTAVNLIETLLSLEPQKRGTASSALMSEYFNTKPYACEPSSLPKYPPNKEIDAKIREDGRRKKGGTRVREPGASRKPRRVRKALQESNRISKLAPKVEVQENTLVDQRNDDSDEHTKGKGGFARGEPVKTLFDTMSETSQVMNATQGDSSFIGPAQVSASSGFTWAKRPKEDATSTISDGSKSKISALDPSFAKTSYSTKKDNGHLLSRVLTNSYEIAKQTMQQQHHHQFDTPDIFEASDGYKNRGGHIGFSGPLLSQPLQLDEFLQMNESHVRQGVSRSKIERD